MLAAVDVHYLRSTASVGCVIFDDWQANTSISEHTLTLNTHEPYTPGQFYKRELPCILAIVEKLDTQIETIVIDGYVWLAPHQPGMGHHLFEALNSQVSVIGVAKKTFTANDAAKPIYRGESQRPLYVTASGIDPEMAADAIQSMHGTYRIPTLLKQVDALCRCAAMDAHCLT